MSRASFLQPKSYLCVFLKLIVEINNALSWTGSFWEFVKFVIPRFSYRCGSYFSTPMNKQKKLNKTAKGVMDFIVLFTFIDSFVCMQKHILGKWNNQFRRIILKIISMNKQQCPCLNYQIFENMQLIATNMQLVMIRCSVVRIIDIFHIFGVSSRSWVLAKLPQSQWSNPGECQ